MAKALQTTGYTGGGATDTFTVEPKPVPNLRVKAAIAACESNNNPLAKNPHSSAKGIYQFLDGTWAHYAKLKWGTGAGTRHVLNEADNRELGEWVIDTYGTGDWEASRYCWG